MLVIECPHCGPRNSSEFTYGGTVSPRPGPEPTPQEWRKYLYEEDNLAGVAPERWFHVNGCRRFLDVQRNTITNEIVSVEAVGT